MSQNDQAGLEPDFSDVPEYHGAQTGIQLNPMRVAALKAEAKEQRFLRAGLKRCRECGHRVSQNARACPSCGADDPSMGQVAHGILSVIMVILSLLLLVVIGTCALTCLPILP